MPLALIVGAMHPWTPIRLLHLSAGEGAGLSRYRERI